MPGLLDLPPELIEQVYDHFGPIAPAYMREALRPVDRYYNKLEGRSFRLANRYIQRATRRSFASTHFWERHVKTYDDASIQKFCAVIDVADLAQCLIDLSVEVEEDRVMRLDHSTLHSRPAKIWSKNILIRAFAACPNLRFLQFYNRLLNPASALSLGLRSDQYITDSEAGKQEEASQMALIERLHDNEVMQFDISSSYFHIFHLLEAAGVSPSIMDIRKQPSHDRIRVGLTNWIDTEKCKAALSKLVGLSLVFLEDPLNSFTISLEKGRRIGHQLAASLEHMPALNSLIMECEPGLACVGTWRILARASAPPRLSKLRLDICDINLCDYATFVLSQIDTLCSLDTQVLSLRNATRYDLGKLYADIRARSKINSFRQGHVYLDAIDQIVFPARLRCPHDEDAKEEDDYFEIIVSCWLIWWDEDDVQKGLTEIAEFLQSE